MNAGTILQNIWLTIVVIGGFWAIATKLDTIIELLKVASQRLNNQLHHGLCINLHKPFFLKKKEKEKFHIMNTDI